MIKGCVQISENISRVEAKGEPAVLYAEICEIIRAALMTLSPDERRKFQKKMISDVKSFPNRRQNNDSM